MQQVQVNETILEEILYFSDQNTEEYVVEDNVKKPSLGLLLKRSSDNLPGTIDDVINQMVYGNCRQPPGDENSPYQKLLVTKYDAQIPGVWAPANSMCKAMALKWFFPNVSGPFKLCEEKPVAPHVIMAYDAFKYREVMELLNIHPDAVMKYGFFSNDVPGEAQLLAKTVDQFEKKLTPPTYEEKIVVLLAKNRDWYDAFYDLGPSYSSSDAVEGEKEAVLFFPAGYDIPEDVVMETKKKPKKKAKSRIAAVAAETPEDETAQVDSESAVETALETEDQLESELTEEKATEIDDEESEEAVQEIDKATSPMDADKNENVDN